MAPVPDNSPEFFTDEKLRDSGSQGCSGGRAFGSRDCSLRPNLACRYGRPNLDSGDVLGGPYHNTLVLYIDSNHCREFASACSRKTRVPCSTTISLLDGGHYHRNHSGLGSGQSFVLPLAGTGPQVESANPARRWSTSHHLRRVLAMLLPTENHRSRCHSSRPQFRGNAQ